MRTLENPKKMTFYEKASLWLAGASLLVALVLLVKALL
jgi:hypothetical protein